MNIQKVFEALENDQQNSALGIICGEFEDQGYGIKIDDTQVSADGFFNGDHQELEAKTGPLNFLLMKGKERYQEFTIEFVDFHDFILKRKIA